MDPWARRPPAARLATDPDGARMTSRATIDANTSPSIEREATTLNATPSLAVDCTDVTLAFGDRRILDHLRFAVPVGEHVAIMGPSGSGKTSLLHILAGITKPDDGSVNVAGLALHKARSKARAIHRQHKVSMVFQFGELLPELRVGENVALPLLLRGDVPKAGLVDSVLAAVGLDNAAAWPAQLSGGETQRVAVARALITRPEVLLCDEPTGALDEANSSQVVSLLREAAARSSATLVVSTHDQAVASQMRSIYDLANGQLVRR